MISILIPTYNYNITALVTELHKQATSENIPFEIVIIDDGSTNQGIITQNNTVNTLPFTTVITSQTNNGRTYTRQLLAEKASYSWLLFLDADVLPKKNDFINKYYLSIKKTFDVVYGGIAYQNKKPNPEQILRWKYGSRKENISAFKRNKTPYKTGVSANFLIKKETFLFVNAKLDYHAYGLDNYFSSLLKTNNNTVLHINNNVYHLGLEKSTVYLQKVTRSMNTLLMLYKKGEITTHQNQLLTIFIRCEKFKLNYLLSTFYKCFSINMKKNLISKSPSIFLLQLYKISYLCFSALTNKNTHADA